VAGWPLDEIFCCKSEIRMLSGSGGEWAVRWNKRG
jgi:hypothetical protein